MHKSTTLIVFLWALLVAALLLAILSKYYHTSLSQVQHSHSLEIRNSGRNSEGELTEACYQLFLKVVMQQQHQVLPLKKDSRVLPSSSLDTPRNKIFALNLSHIRFTTIADHLNATNGTYGGVGFEMVSRRTPRAFLLHDVLQPEECDTIVDEAKEDLARSEVVHVPGNSGVNSIRTSFGMFIMNPNNLANEKLRRTIAMMCGVPVHHIESTQVLRYTPGQYYRAHPDYFGRNSPELNRGGERFVTVLTWLNEVDAGGQTRFPYSQPHPITLRPQRGKSVLFYSLTESGDTDPTSMHEAIPPTNGSLKWVAVQWVREHVFH